MPVPVRVSTEVHDGGDAGEGPVSHLATHPACRCNLLERVHVVVRVRHQAFVQWRDLVCQVVEVLLQTGLLLLRAMTGRRGFRKLGCWDKSHWRKLPGWPALSGLLHQTQL